jgi:hypothetical protein
VVSYHITGAISAVIFLLTVTGLWAQLNLIWTRKAASRGGAGSCHTPLQDHKADHEQDARRPTAILSLNQFVSSFLAFFSFYLYGMSLNPLNHYLVWPRLVACLLTLAMLWEIAADRREAFSITAFGSCGLMLAAAPVVVTFGQGNGELGQSLSKGFIVAVTAILAQGYIHQVVLIRRSGHTGAVSLRMHQFFFLKDASTIVFALTMGVGKGWPVLLMSCVSAVTKLAIMWQFRWARSSSLARERRSSLNKTSPEALYAPGA